MLIRPRRLRRTAALRELVAETHIHPSGLVQPHFVLPDQDKVEPLSSMPGIDRMGVKPLVRRVEADLELGIRSVLLFGIPAHKDARGSAGEDPAGRVLLAFPRRERPARRPHPAGPSLPGTLGGCAGARRDRIHGMGHRAAGIGAAA